MVDKEVVRQFLLYVPLCIGGWIKSFPLAVMLCLGGAEDIKCALRKVNI